MKPYMPQKKPKESRVTEKATIPMKADAAYSISMKAVIASLNVPYQLEARGRRLYLRLSLS